MYRKRILAYTEIIDYKVCINCKYRFRVISGSHILHLPVKSVIVGIKVHYIFDISFKFFHCLFLLFFTGRGTCTAYFPSITDDDKGGVSIGGASLWMLDNQDDAKKAATWEFVKYLVSAESQAYWNAQTGYFPVTTAAHDEQVFKDNIAKYPQFQTAIDQLHDSAPEYAGALLSVFPEARAIVETEIENMLNGKESAEDAVSKMASDMNKSIEDYNLLNE